MEVGAMGDANEMIPAQLQFPITQTVSLGDVYTPTLNTQGTGTVCSVCHVGDSPRTVAPGVTAHATGQVIPAASADVPISQISTLAAHCDASSDAQRCALLDALTRPEAPTQYHF